MKSFVNGCNPRKGRGHCEARIGRDPDTDTKKKKKTLYKTSPVALTKSRDWSVWGRGGRA